MTEKPKLIDKLSVALPREGMTLLRAVLRCADDLDFRAFLVGGPVRDLILERPLLDLDIAVEGDGIPLARKVASASAAKLVKTTAFGTAAIHLEGFVLDLVTARSESYVRPGALPKVHPATIDTDLLRRDFTCNAVALALNGSARGRLLDPVGGGQDIHAGRIRVLHDRSFQDDATRIIRAVRYETRLQFTLEERTRDLLRRDVSFLDTISGTRIRQELARTFEEQRPPVALQRLQELGILSAIHPSLRVTSGQAKAFERWAQASAPAATAWPLLAWETPSGDLPAVAARLSLPRIPRAAVEAIPALRELEPRLAGDLRPSEVHELLAGLPVEAVTALAFAASKSVARERVSQFLASRHVRPFLRGDDTVALGVKQGPDVGEVMRRLRLAKLDGEVTSRADEEALVKQYLAR
jgi:tRNA nucleotidyltransferase (CCA-adding enzyme)